MKRVNTFVDMDTKLVGGSEVREEGSETREESSSKRGGDELEQEPLKKQKMEDDKETPELQNAEISFDREDLETLWKLVKAKHGYTRPEEGYERVLSLVEVRCGLECGWRGLYGVLWLGVSGPVCVGFNPLVHSFCALSTLRRSGLRTASAAAKPCQGDSLEFYLITGRIPTVAAAGQRHVNSQPHAHTSYS
ncbi:hypothetical protein Tco_1303357 [Tanacetum coccineum]